MLIYQPEELISIASHTLNHKLPKTLLDTFDPLLLLFNMKMANPNAKTPPRPKYTLWGNTGPKIASQPNHGGGRYS
jgi:hypothetical protein